MHSLTSVFFVVVFLPEFVIDSSSDNAIHIPVIMQDAGNMYKVIVQSIKTKFSLNLE